MSLVTASNWSTVSRLLDEALDLEANARAAWLERLRRSQPEFAPALEQLLAAHARVETAELLQTLPNLDWGAAPAIDGSERQLAEGSARPPPPLAAPTRLEPGTLVGPYRLIRELGVGGMAHVWLAARADGAFERDIALKLPQISLLRRHLAERFARERDILARLEHPHIARLYDAGVAADGTPYLAMEYVQGQSIHTWCDQRKLDLTARLALFDQVLAAVQYAHANLVIHRDLKPSNILVDASGADGMGQVRLLDFGIAKLVADDERAHETQLTALSGRAMTPDYASPEQILGEPLTIASDVYSLGVVLFELLTGGRPYKLKLRSGSPLAPAHLELAILDAEAASPSSALTPESAAARGTTVARLARALRGDLDTIVRKALAKQPAQRYATVAEFAADLERHRDGEPVLAQPASWRYRLGKFVVRNRLAVGAAATILVAIVGGAGAALYQAQIARAEAARADDVKRLVLSIFESAEPTAGSSRKTTAVELLSQARARIATARFADVGTRIELSTSIGLSMILLGENVEATVLLEEMAALAASHLGPTDPRRAAVEHALGRVLVVRNDKRARPLLEASEHAMRVNGDAVGLTESLRWKTGMLIHEGKLGAAVDAAREGLAVAEALPEDQRARPVLRLSLAMATALQFARQPGQLPHARRAVALAEQLHGKAGPSSIVLTARRQLATALRSDGEFEEARNELVKTLHDLVEVLGPEHIEVAGHYAQLAHVEWRRGDIAAAIEATQRHESIERRVTGDQASRSRLLTFETLGAEYLMARRFAESEAALKQADALVAQLDPELDAVWTMRSVWLQLYVRTGRIAEADALLERIIRRSPTSPSNMAGRNMLTGYVRTAQKRYDEAETAMAAAAAELGKDRRFLIEHARALAGVGTARLGAGRVAESIEPLQQSLAIYAKYQTVISPERRETEAELARAEARLGKPVAAAR